MDRPVELSTGAGAPHSVLLVDACMRRVVCGVHGRAAPGVKARSSCNIANKWNTAWAEGLDLRHTGGGNATQHAPAAPAPGNPAGRAHCLPAQQSTVAGESRLLAGGGLRKSARAAAALNAKRKHCTVIMANIARPATVFDRCGSWREPVLPLLGGRPLASVSFFSQPSFPGNTRRLPPPVVAETSDLSAREPPA